MKCCENIRKGDTTDTACSTGAERQSSLQLLKLTGHGKQVTTILSCLVSVLLADSWQVFGCQEVLHLMEAASRPPHSLLQLPDLATNLSVSFQEQKHCWQLLPC